MSYDELHVYLQGASTTSCFPLNTSEMIQKAKVSNRKRLSMALIVLTDPLPAPRLSKWRGKKS